MRFLVLGFRSDVRIELQAPVDSLLHISTNATECLFHCSDVIDVAAIETQGMEHNEYHDRARQYR